MSFQSLISGSDCAAPSNPLSQVLKHAEGDRSLQQDRIAGPSSARVHHLPGTSVGGASQHDISLARQFFDSPSQLISPPAHPHLHPTQGPSQSNLQQAWRSEHAQSGFHPNSIPQSSWASEFAVSPSANTQAPLTSQNLLFQSEAQQPSYLPQQASYSARPYSMYSGMTPYTPSYNYPSMDQGKGKGKAKDADFEAAFAQVDASLAIPRAEPSGIVEVEDGVTDIEEAFRQTKLDPESQLPDFSTLVNDTNHPPTQDEVAKWEANFNEFMNSQRDDLDFDYGSTMQQAWENGLGSKAQTGFEGKPLEFDSEGLPLLGDYVFESDNKYIDPSTSSTSPLSDAKALLDQNGSLSEVALLLEAAIQKGDLGEGGYEAWILLGETRNMDEREEQGMKALMQGVKIAEAANASGAGMLSLAISFTNESFDRGSQAMLLRWLRARYPSQEIPEVTMQAMSNSSTWDTHDRVTNLFLNLARTQHAHGTVDADVQTALGVLFYTNNEYDRAKDCFESALSARPKDYLLWNRLGSSLSNGNRPEEALGVYREALQLRPTYTRAIYNVGVACLNIGAHKEAAEHFLSAIALQNATNGETSDQLWFTLRRALLQMDRPDLAEQARGEVKGNLDMFRHEGFDF